MRKQFGRDKIVILLGAGASCDAGMKNSFQMITEIEHELYGRWKRYHDLYNYIHSSHYHLERIKGTNRQDIIFNIEHLLALLDGIIKISDKKVDIYPFIGSWEKELYSVAGNNFEKASEFKKEILERLKNKWLSPDDWKSKSSYYKKLKEIQYNYPLKIFSLNYDLCVEHNITADGTILERGFNEERLWDYRRYEPSDEKEVSYFLYKLHGSLDWKRDQEKRLKFVDEISATDPLNMEIIFGVQNKLQSYDPYLFYFYSFKEACIEADLIVVSGYGFLDEHINDNLINAIKLDPGKMVLVNVYEDKTDREMEVYKSYLASKLELRKENMHVINTSAKDFFNKYLNVEYFGSLFPETNDDAAL